MPLTLRPPRPGKTPNYEIRGTYLGVAVERSARTSDKKLAVKVLRTIKREIEQDRFAPHTDTDKTPKTFLLPVKAYLLAGGDGSHLSPIIEMTGPNSLRDLPIDDIDQMKIDLVAAELYPDATPQTRNRQFYTPVVAVLRRAGIERRFKRPKGWRGVKSKWWLKPEQAFALLDAARKLDIEFWLLCLTLLYTGMRISEALNAKVRHVDLKDETLYLPTTKNGEERHVYLPPIVTSAMGSIPPRSSRATLGTRQQLIGGKARQSQIDAGIGFLNRNPDAKLFRFHDGGRLRGLLTEAMHSAGLSFPRRYRGFHLFCHSFGTWMSRYGNLDNYGLTRTGRWKDARSAEGYVHTEGNEEARRAAMLPTPPIRGETGERKINQDN